MTEENQLRAAGQLARSFLPATAVLEMTYRCNHACLFCSCPWYADNNTFDCRPELSIEHWRGVITKLCGMGCNNIAFTGGEPLLKDGIHELLAYTAEQQVEFVETVDGELVSSHGPPKLYLLSNGKAMDEGTLQLCRDHEIHLSLSLPGLESFPEHNQAGTSAQTILDWFRAAHEIGVGTTVGVTVTRRNIDELFETIAHAFLAGADELLMNRFLPGGRGLQYADELSLDRAQINLMLDIAEDVLTEADRYGSVGTELPKCVVDRDDYQRLQVGTRCSAALDFFVVDPSGYVRVCNHSQVRLAHVDGIEDVKTDPYWMRFVMKDYLPSACGSCSMLADCDGGCREAAHICGGCVTAADPLLPAMKTDGSQGGYSE